ncbi:MULTISPECIES: hypothetical protein, partial [Pseudonocardia]
MLVVAGVARGGLVAGAAVRVLGVIVFVVLVPAMSGIPALVGRLTVAGMACVLVEVGFVTSCVRIL